MATQKKNSGNQVKNSVGISRNIYSNMGNGNNVSDDKKRDDENIPWTLLITVMAVLLTFFIVMPLLAFMYYDLYFAHQAAIIEIKKMQQLRREIQLERMYDK